ncbi:MAG: TraX family protein [Methanobrevibacter sp.]|nr:MULTISPECIES: TraX family protein [Methanobrevibacter]MDY3096382.1 TraX family protein [Methanobrevibacter sp.]
MVGLLYVFDVRLLANPFYLSFTWNFIMFRLGIFLVPFLLLFYNGKPGSKASIHKWFFYIFYPTHLIFIGILGFVFHIGMYFT